MKRNLLCLLMSLFLLLITCGNEPHEEFYEGTPEDSTAIHELLNDNAELLITNDMFYEPYIPLTMAEVNFFEEDSYFRGDSIIIKRHVDSCGLMLDSLNSMLGLLDFWFAKDTTCTVYLFDTFAVVSQMHIDVKIKGYYDSPIVDTATGETLGWRIGTGTIDSTPYYDQTDVLGQGRRLMFFEPERDTTPTVDPETGDTTYAIIEPFNWIFKRISYGAYYFPAPGPDIPAIAQVTLTREDGTEETIISSSLDTLYTGHCMNRFRALDSLLEFTDGETLTVEVTLGFGTVTADIAEFFASCGGTERVELPVPTGGTGGVGSLIVHGNGITNLYFEVVTNAYYYYERPERDYIAQVWLVPVRIGGVP